MNTYAVIILVALLGEFIVELMADLLNMTTLSYPLPQEFQDVHDTTAYARSQFYEKTKLRFGILTSAVSLAVTLIFWLSGAFNGLDGVVRGWGFNSIWTGLAYIGILILSRAVVSLPFSLYSTFVIEERFGFNKTTLRIFFGDVMKLLALGIALGGPLLGGILWFFEFAGSAAWLYCWLIGTGFTVVIQFIAPAWIMPLFNKFTPLPEGELKQRICALAESVKFSLKDVFVMDGSKRSTKSNALFTGFGKNKRIALFDTLITQQSVPELVAVLAHEIGHYKKRHILQRMVISFLHMGVMFFLLSLIVSERELFEAFFVEQPSIYTGMIFFGMLFAPIEFFLSLVLHAISRRHEFEADRFAAETTHEPESMVGALKKLSVNNLSHLTPHHFYVFLNYSHPPVIERIKALLNVRTIAD